MTQQSGRIWVMGGRPLNGTAAIPAAKNSVLPLLAAALLCRGPVRLRAVPRLSDVECSLGLLRGAGCAAHWQGADIVVAGMPSNSTLPGETAAQMRASILFCAPLLARLGRAETSLPGGCNIGARPIDLHLEGLARMGAKELDAGRESWCWPRRGDSTGQTSPSASPAWGRRRHCCWPLLAPEAPPSCGARRGSRRSLTLPTS